MYSDMSIWMIASSVPNMNLARHLDSQVLPTPEGPRKMKQPIGRIGSLRPERERRTAREIAVDRAVLVDDLDLELVLHGCSRRCASAWSRRLSGMPVILLTVSAMISSSTLPPVSWLASFSRHSFWIVSFFFASW